MTSANPESRIPNPGLSAADRDELALVAFGRLRPFEAKVLALIYGLAGIGGADGACHSVKATAALCKCSGEKIDRVAREALAKLAAVLDLEPIAAGRHLFRMGTHWQALGRRLEAGSVQFGPANTTPNPQSSHDLHPQNPGTGIPAATQGDAGEDRPARGES